MVCKECNSNNNSIKGGGEYYYLEKCNGSFKALSIEAAARLQHEEELRLNPKKEPKAKGFQNK